MLIMLVCGLVIMSGLLVQRSEEIIEGAIMEQAKQQARIFLLGAERELQVLGDPSKAENLAVVFDDVMQRHDWGLAFAIREIYAYDREGRIIAVRGGEGVSREMSGKYGDVLTRDRSYLGSEVEYKRDPRSGSRVPVVDVIIPLHHQGEVVAGLEVEVDLAKTRDIIKQHDNSFERDMLLWLSLFGLVLVVFFWLVARKVLIAPVQRIAGVTQQIAAGDMGTRLVDLSGDELGRLGDSINVMADSIGRLLDEQEQAYLQSMQSLAKALQAKDAYTAKHSGRVAKFSVMLGRRLGLAEDELVLLKQGALMHDLGKISIPDAILNKPERLTEDEFEIMRGHPEATAAIMRPLKRFKAFADIAAWHHERWDGNGYPDGLKGEQIPLLARIVGLADTWDAMTGDRVYRKGMSERVAIDIIAAERNSGQWDPELVDAFVDMINARLDDRDAMREDFESV